MPELDRLYYTLGIETTDFEQGIAKAENNFSKLTQGIASMAATLGISLGLKNVIKDVQNLTMNFDQATRQIWTLLDITDDEFKKLQQSIIELSKQGVYSAEEIANAMYQAVSSGIEAEQAISFISDAMKAAQAGASDLFTVVDGLTTVMNAWGYSAEEVSKINDILFLGVDKGKTTFEELSSSIGLVAPTASQAGVSLEEVIAAIAAMTQQGLSTSRAVFSLNQAIMSIIAPSEQAKKVINELGIEFNETALREQGFAAVLNEAYEAANGNVEVLTTLFGSVQALRAVLSLTGEGAENFTSILEQMETVAGKTDAAYEKMQGSLENTRKQMQNMFDAIKLEIGQAMLPFLQWVTNIGMAFAQWIEQMSPAEKVIIGVTGALVALIPIMQTVNLLLNALKISTGNWIGALFGISAAVGASVAAFGTLNQHMKNTAEEAERAKKALEGLSAAELQTLNENLTKSTVEAASLNEEVKNTAERYITLIELVRKYNDLQAINSLEAEGVKSQIEALLNMYPELNNSVYYTGTQYELQIEYLKAILSYELERINAQIELQKQQLSAAQSVEVIQQQIKATRDELEQARSDVQRYQEMLETSARSKQLNKTVQDWYNTSIAKVSELEMKLENLNELAENRAKAEAVVAELQMKQSEIQEKIKGLSAESLKIQQIEQTKRQIEDLNAAVEEQIKILEEIPDKTSDSYAAQYEIVSKTVENMKKTINSYINAMIEQGEITDETRKLMLMLIEVDKRLETIKPEIVPIVQTIDVDAIRQNIELARKIFETESIDIAKTFYQQTASEVNRALIQAIRLGDENMINALRSYKENIDAIGAEINESVKTTISIDENVMRTIEEDIKQKLGGLQRAIEAEDKDIAKQMYTELLNYVSNALKQAYIENNQETIAMLKQYENEISKYAMNFVDTLSASLSSEEIQNQLGLINQAMELGLTDLANTLAGSLKQRINQELQELINVEDAEIQINELKSVLSEIDEIISPNIVTDIQNDIEMLKRAYQEGLMDFANTLEAYVSSTLSKQLYEAWKNGNDELYNEILRLQTMFEQIQIELKPIEITEIGININQIQKDFETLNLYIEKGYIELAHRLSPKLYQDIMKGLEQAIQEGNEKILQQMLNFKEQYEEIMQSLTISAVPITDEIRNNLALLSKAYEEGLTDFADILKSSITRTLNEELFKAWQEGNEALYNELLSLKETYEMLQSTFEVEEVKTTALEESIQKIKANLELMNKYIEAGYTELAKNLSSTTYSEIMRAIGLAIETGNYEILDSLESFRSEYYEILSSISVGYEDALEDIKIAVQKYQEAILSGQTDIAEQIKRNVESQIRSLKYDVFFEGNIEAMQAIEMVSQDWQNILEEIRTQELEPILLQINELETIANDVNKSFEERLNALEKIKQLQKDANIEESRLAITTQRINELEKERQRLLEEEKETISEQADLMNSILSSIESALENMGEMGKLIATILKSVNFEVSEIIENGEVIGYKLVNPFEDIEKLTRDISVNIAQWGIEQIGIMFTNLIDDLKEAFAEPSKWINQTLTSTAELFKNFNEYERNLRKKQQLEAKQAAERVGATAVGGLLGWLLGGPLGALIGAGIGAAVGNAAAETLSEQIAALDEKLLVSWQAIKEALGTDIDSIANALERAFDATTYEDFVNNFSTSLEDMTKQALIRAFLASEAMQPLLSALSDTISAAVVDGVLSASEKAAILKAQEDLLDLAGPFFEILEEMFKSAETETQLYGREYRPAAATITEATANRLEALLSTINLNVMRITNKMLYETIRVEVTNIRAIAGISPDAYIKSIGG